MKMCESTESGNKIIPDEKLKISERQSFPWPIHLLNTIEIRRGGKGDGKCIRVYKEMTGEGEKLRIYSERAL